MINDKLSDDRFDKVAHSACQICALLVAQLLDGGASLAIERRASRETLLATSMVADRGGVRLCSVQDSLL